MYGRRVDRAQPAVDRERLDRRRRADQRCEGTTWKASPAWMYSSIRATAASNASRGMFERERGASAAAARAGSSRGSGPREALAHLSIAPTRAA